MIKNEVELEGSQCRIRGTNGIFTEYVKSHVS